MENKNKSDLELRNREAITNEHSLQLAEIDYYTDIIENLLSADDTIQKLENLAIIRCEVIQRRNKWLAVNLIDVNAEIEKLKSLNDIGLLYRKGEIDFSNLLEKLKPYFKDCSLLDLETIIKHKQLPIGREQILWSGVKADAIRFAEHFGLTNVQFNNIFSFIDNVKLHRKHRHKDGAGSLLTEILKKHPN